MIEKFEYAVQGKKLRTIDYVYVVLLKIKL